MKNRLLFLFLLLSTTIFSQGLRLPQTANLPSMTGRKLGVTEIEIRYNAPGVKGREGNIWGTNVAPFGFQVLGFGSNVASPWRAGADECTTISFSTEVKINGQSLPAGKYAFFIALGENESELIFNKNTEAWGAYFYDQSLDVLRVKTRQIKNRPESVERLKFDFIEKDEKSAEIVLDWEKWRIPFTVEVDLVATTLADLKSQMSGVLGFDPASLQAAANWCLTNDVNLEEALNWINSASSPNLGGQRTFNTLSTKSGILEKLNRMEEASQLMKEALEIGNAIELHQYGRRLLAQGKKGEAMKVFDMNYQKHNGAWPTNVGMMRGYSALGDFKKALEFAEKALEQAPDDLNKGSLANNIKALKEGKDIN